MARGDMKPLGRLQQNNLSRCLGVSDCRLYVEQSRGL